jgi:hypothetical protein
MGRSLQRGQDIEALAPGGRFDKEPLHAPENPEKRRKHEVGRIHEEDRPLARLRFG